VLAAARAASQKQFVKVIPSWPADQPMRKDEFGVQWADFRPEKSDAHNTQTDGRTAVQRADLDARISRVHAIAPFFMLNFVCCFGLLFLFFPPSRPAFATSPPCATRTATWLGASTART